MALLGPCFFRLNELNLKFFICFTNCYSLLTDTRPSENEEGTLTEDVPEDQRNACCISDEIALKLGMLSLKVRIQKHISSDSQSFLLASLDQKTVSLTKFCLCLLCLKHSKTNAV